MDIHADSSGRGRSPSEPTARHAGTPVKPTEAGLELAAPKRILLLFARALRLRCPNCGQGRVLASWFRLRPSCSACGLHFQRGEHDYYTGAMLFNLVVAELLFAGILLLVLLWMWPVVPWDFLQYGGIAMMILFPFLLYPFSQTIWMAFDLMLRPPLAEEFEPRPGASGPSGA